MPELVTDCPRCDSNMITFDAHGAIKIGERHGWQNWYEAFCICRHCHKSTIFVLSENVDSKPEYVHKVGLLNIESALNNYVDIERFVSLRDHNVIEPPEYIPTEIETIFREGSTCLTVDCFNASGTMFRLCVDLATRSMLPEKDINGLNTKIRHTLGLRLKWLFENKELPESLRDLSLCIKEDGNDGAHAGTLTEPDAEDLLDFTIALLERIYTEPERLRLAQERRDNRRKK